MVVSTGFGAHGQVGRADTRKRWRRIGRTVGANLASKVRMLMRLAQPACLRCDVGAWWQRDSPRSLASCMRTPTLLFGGAVPIRDVRSTRRKRLVRSNALDCTLRNRTMWPPAGVTQVYGERDQCQTADRSSSQDQQRRSVASHHCANSHQDHQTQQTRFGQVESVCEGNRMCA